MLDREERELLDSIDGLLQANEEDESFEKENGYFILIDKNISKYIPSWCGYSHSNNSWEKLEKIIKRNGR